MAFSFWALLLLLFCSATDVQFAHAELRLMLEVCRHGARSPLTFIQGDPNNASTWVGGPGQLTAVGMRQHYLVGHELRRRLVLSSSFLGGSYSASQVWVRSSDFVRTIQSAQSQMFGLFPEGLTVQASIPAAAGVPPFQVEGQPEVVKALGNNAMPHRFQPVPIQTVDGNEEYLLRSYELCPRVRQLFHERMLSTEWKRVEEENKEFLSQVARLASMESLPLVNVSVVSDPLVAELWEGRPLPNGFSAATADRLAGLYDFVLSQLFHSKESQRLSVSVFFSDVLHKMDAEIHGSAAGQRRPELRFGLYSAHDSTVAAVLASLGVWDFKNPPFASTLFFELHKTVSGQDFVRVIYNDRPLQIEGCAVNCSYTQFSLLLRELIVPNFSAVCIPPPDLPSLVASSLSPESLLTPLLIVLLFVCAVFTIPLYHRFSRSSWMTRKSGWRTMQFGVV
eukprot:GILJ01004457.1.p1 GENE.GILJ01004457.1~~GILJ01004457.1.p1  ORF type:complete len:451 (+),score=61.98 GILJ01004457.1:38-1390(+)